ncbi:MAG: hypothetical protein LBK91_06610, partial [Synergistaceae bacterium]|nr:hypothetical protein [Synergistaceae bacterium]
MRGKTFGSFSAIFERAKVLTAGRVLTAISCLLFVLIVAVFIRSLSLDVPTGAESSLLKFLPEPAHGASVIMINARRGEFPGNAARFFADTSAVRRGASWMTFFMPVLDSADATALLIAEYEEALSVCGVFVPGLEEYDLLDSGELPGSWKRIFAAAELRSAGRRGVYRLSADNISEPFYLAAADDLVFVADTREGIDRIMAVNDGSSPGIGKKWAVEPQWGGHVYLSDGGLLSEAVNGAGDSSARGNFLEIEAAWSASDDVRASAAKWEISGAENIVNRAFLNDLRPREWDGVDLFIPDPLVLSFGINLPNPGRTMPSLPAPLKYAAEQMRKMGMRRSEIQAILTGLSSFSLGGRTGLLWFELPGVAVDLQERGEASFKLIDRFWSELFIGAEPKPVEGFSHGGVTNLPFTILAAANGDRTVIGLLPP